MLQECYFKRLIKLEELVERNSKDTKNTILTSRVIDQVFALYPNMNHTSFRVKISF